MQGGSEVSDSVELLRLRILLAFHDGGQGKYTVTGISRGLRVEKQKVSREMIRMEKEGLLDRSNVRAPQLTEKGRSEAGRYAEKIRLAQNHLLYEGVALESAQYDAYMWALHCSDDLMDVIRRTDACYRVKNELKDLKRFSGDQVCRLLEDGNYEFPFVIYREQVKNGQNLSMGNEGFAHPCTLHVEDGVGMVQLLIQSMEQRSVHTGTLLKGKVDKLKYFVNGIMVDAEFVNNVVFFPAEALNFVNMGSGTGNILHGSVSLRMRCSCGLIHMPESDAIFTLLI